MTKMNFVFLSFFTLCHFISDIGCVRHARNLIWAQSPNMQMGVSRIVGIEGDPATWVPDGNVQVRHISAPHHGWQFKGLAYNYETQMLYWSESTNKKIQGLRLNGSTETETLFTGTSSMSEGLVVDWVSNNIYWTDSLYNWIMMASLATDTPGYKIVVRTDLSNPHGIAVHPKKGYLFWTDSGYDEGGMSKIEVSDLLGQNRRVIVDSDIQRPKGLAVDFADELLYWVDSGKDTIESSSFSGNNRRVVAFQSGTIFFGIAVFDKYLFVTEQLQGHLRIYDKQTANNEINYQLGHIPDGVVMYDSTIQEGNGSACEAKGCEQICVNDPLAGPICRCGEKFDLSSDGLTCVASPGFSVPSHIYAIGDAICQYPINLPDMSLFNRSLDSQCFKRGGRGYFGLAYDAREHELYYSENVTKSIGRINVDNEMGETIMKGVGDVQAMALDWVTGCLFWTSTTYSHVSMARKSGMYPKVILEDLDKPMGIAVHPHRGQVYWGEQGTTPSIYVASMDGSNKQLLVNNTAIGMPNHLYIDFKQERLYWADSGLYAVKYVDLNSLEVSAVYNNVEQQVTFFGISLYQDYVLWTDKVDERNGIHAARLDKQEKVRGILHPGSGLSSQLVTFDTHNQPDLRSACDNNGYCEHMCLPTSNDSYICACGLGYTLDENLRTCSSSVTTDNYVVTVDSYQKQIYQVNVNTGLVNAIPLAKPYKGVAVDINKFTNEIFWSDNEVPAIMTARITGVGEKIFRMLPAGSISDGLAVDYINQLLFYTCTNYDIIVAVSLKNPSIYRTIINDSLDEPREIIAHSEKGQLYWTDWGATPKIETASMTGGNRSVLHTPGNGSWPNALALDKITMNLYWVDAKKDSIERINVDTGVKSIVYHEPQTHFFGVTLLDGYLYVTDWFRKYVSRLKLDGSTVLEQVGPAKFSRLNGITAYKKSDVRTVFSVCLESTCSNLCLPVSETDYRCGCSDEGKYAAIPCREQNQIDVSVYDNVKQTRRHKTNARDGTLALTIGLSVVGVIGVIVVAVAGVFIYNKRFRGANIPHNKLEEDTARVDTFYRITFPDGSKDEPNFDSGIENPSFDCSIEDVRQGTNIVRYSPM